MRLSFPNQVKKGENSSRLLRTRWYKDVLPYAHLAKIVVGHNLWLGRSCMTVLDVPGFLRLQV